MARLVKTDRNGTKYYEGLVTCDRCGGAGGHVAWSYTGWTCYKCGGTGKMQGKWKEYTPEYEAKLAAKRRAHWEKIEAEFKAEEEARKAKEEAERKAREAKEEAERQAKAKSQYIGEVGEKVELQATLETVIRYTAKAFVGFGEETRLIYRFKAGDNTIVWYTGTGKYAEAEGKTVTLTGVVKKHEEYKDEKQTILTRCKVVAPEGKGSHEKNIV